MKKSHSVVTATLLCALVAISSQLLAASITASSGRAGGDTGLVLPPSTMKIAASYGELPLQFEVNQGQFDPAVRFAARQRGYTLFLGSGEVDIAPRKRSDSAAVRMKLIGANPNSPATGLV